ncbi:MAG: Dabb family protein [Pirellulaceae bacterium]
MMNLKTTTTTIIIGLLLGLFVSCLTTSQVGADDKDKSVYRHVVMFQFNEEVSKTQVTEVEDAFMALSGKIDTIVDIEFGTNVSPEELNDGLTHCFLVTFKNKAGLEVYLPHAAHQKFVDLVKPRLEKVMVIDYVNNK